MFKYRLTSTILLICLYALPVCAQQKAEMLRAFNNIKLSLCSANIPLAIKELEEFEKNYPDEKLVYVTDKILGDIYLKHYRLADAKQKYLYALQASERSGTVPSLVMDTACGSNLIQYFYSYGPADICVPLSGIYRRLGFIDSSYHYLDLADRKLNPFSGSGRDSLLYHVYLTPYFVEHYLAAKDTASAINRTLDNFMATAGNTRKVTASLKRTLHLKYTRARIKRELNKGISNLVVTKPEQKEQPGMATMIMFDHPFRIYGRFATTAEAQAVLRKDARIRLLMQ